ncbi:hypothetical protein GJ496_006972 [Pomphorhynchus laevis]|nr:hypothetical protein GJ496_006972 [Pomphorhynchus laevis]
MNEIPMATSKQHRSRRSSCDHVTNPSSSYMSRYLSNPKINTSSRQSCIEQISSMSKTSSIYRPRFRPHK